MQTNGYRTFFTYGNMRPARGAETIFGDTVYEDCILVRHLIDLPLTKQINRIIVCNDAPDGFLLLDIDGNTCLMECEDAEKIKQAGTAYLN